MNGNVILRINKTNIMKQKLAIHHFSVGEANLNIGDVSGLFSANDVDGLVYGMKPLNFSIDLKKRNNV